MRRLLRPLWILLALIFLLEAWLWERLEPVVARVVALVPLPALKRWFAGWVAGLSPAATLVVFLVPVVPLFPLKIVGVWLIAHHYFFSALALVIFAKLAGVGITAFVFDVTRDKLLQMDWFRTLYELVLRVVAWAHALVAPYKRAVAAAIRRLRLSVSASYVQRLRRRVQFYR